jgi:hypothetical protein
MPEVVTKEVVDVVSGQGLWYVDGTSVIEELVSVRVIS